MKLSLKLISIGVLLLSGFVGEVAANPENSDNRLRVATFNVSMDASNYLPNDELGSAGATALEEALKSNNEQIQQVAEIIQRTRPDVLVLNEFDYIDAAKGIDVFRSDYLEVAQQGADPIKYPYVYIGPVNTGVPSGHDLDNSGPDGLPANDAWGFGFYPGQYGMVVLSRYPIEHGQVRTFQNFKWKDMPNAMQPRDPETNEPWYSDASWQAFPLSSKSHWDIPITVGKNTVGEKTLHILVSHPTPPVFDGPEDRNGKRNHDEVRFWADYIVREQADYIYDDNGNKGGLAPHTRFVIAGDLNASDDADSANVTGTIEQLLDHPLLQTDLIPQSMGAVEHTPAALNSAFHTASWRKRADYVLPSVYGLEVLGAEVFWPTQDDPLARLVSSRSASSDHRLVWVDIRLR